MGWVKELVVLHSTVLHCTNNMSGRQGSNLMLAACLAMLSYVPFQVGLSIKIYNDSCDVRYCMIEIILCAMNNLVST